MKLRTYVQTTLVLATAGLLFSGYLTAVKIFSRRCAFNEPCPYFLGYPACWYGFGLFLVMFLTAAIALGLDTKRLWPVGVNGVVSFVGILFAGSFVWPEIQTWLASGGTATYQLGLPTCVYGLIFYIIIFILSLTAIRQKK